MGVEGTCRSLNGGGGVSFIAYSLYSNRHILTQGTLQTPPSLHKVKRALNQVGIGQKLIFICSVLSYPRNFGDRKGQKAKNIFKSGEGERLKICPDCLPFIVSTCAGVPASGPAGVGSGPLVVCPMPFVRFSALLSLRRLQIWLYFAF